MIDAGCATQGKRAGHWLIGRVFSRDAWKSRNLENALFAGMLLGMTSFWNGAAVIGGLLILFGFAAFSDGKLDYLVTAAAAVIFAELQARLFIWGNVSGRLSFTGDSWQRISRCRGTVVPAQMSGNLLSRSTGNSVLSERPKTGLSS